MSAITLINWLCAKPGWGENTGLPLYSSASNYCHLNMGVCYFWWRSHSEHTAGNTSSCASSDRENKYKQLFFCFFIYFTSIPASLLTSMLVCIDMGCTFSISPLLLEAKSVFVHLSTKKYSISWTLLKTPSKRRKKTPHSSSWLYWRGQFKKCQSGDDWCVDDLLVIVVVQLTPEGLGVPLCVSCVQ